MMLGFTWDVPGGELSYQAPVPVHVIKEAVWASLTPALEPPPVVIRKRKWVVYFGFDCAELSESEKRKLTGIRSAVRVKGYASPEGSEEYNLRLSKQRAKNVAEFLKRRGVRVLEIKGLGEKSCSFPPETWARCRKVEVEER